ncbi:MAG: hypothetical protein KHW62_07900 [Clostridiales bacterium]|nr:hypothetical protein [Clostridiales bacterium]
MSKDIKLILKGTLYLFARVVLLCVLVFMSIPIASVAPGIFQPIFAVFYFFILLYFFILTMWHEGVRDRNRVEIGLIKENKAKGFISSGILLIFLLIVNYLPMFFDTESENIFVIIISVIKTVFSSSVSYLITLFVGNVDISQTMGGNMERLMISSTVFTVVYIICVIGAGIGYIFGYKNIVVIGDKIEKIKSMFKS